MPYRQATFVRGVQNDPGRVWLARFEATRPAGCRLART
jgi:hypothetical protein